MPVQTVSVATAIETVFPGSAVGAGTAKKYSVGGTGGWTDFFLYIILKGAFSNSGLYPPASPGLGIPEAVEACDTGA